MIIKRSDLTQEKWEKIEKEFLQLLYKYFEEINDSIQQLKKNKDNPFLRSQICLAFVGIDTFSRFNRIFHGEKNENILNKDNERRFKDWLNNFVFTERNKIYKKFRGVIKCDAGVIWRLRNSFIHFYSFPKQKNGENKIGFVFNMPFMEHQKIEQGLKIKGHKATFIDMHYLIRAFLEGFLLQIENLKNLLINEPNKYIDIVLFAHQIVMSESANIISLNLKNKNE